MGVRACFSAATAVIAAAAIAACGSSGSSGNGVSSKSASAIVTASTNALESAKSVHVSGSGSQSGQSISIDLTVVSGKGAQGSLTLQGSKVGLIAVGKYYYLKADKAFWQAHGGAAEAQLLADKWLKLPASGSSFASFSEFTDLHQIASQLAQAKGTVTKGSSTTINGQKAIAVKDPKKGGVLYVATTGKPYPLKVTSTSGTMLGLSFDHYNASVTLSPPANPIDIAQLQGK
jgi:hypothetical protein